MTTNELMVKSVVTSVYAVVLLAFIVKPAASFVWPALIVFFVFNVWFVGRPHILSARVALGANVAIMIATLISKFWIVN